MISFECNSSPPNLSSEEAHAQQLIEAGKLEKGLAIYEKMKSPPPRALNTIAHLYADRKGDYDTAVKYYKQALQIQEKVDDEDQSMENVKFSFRLEWRGYDCNIDSVGYNLS